ncbi:MAG: alpha-amylase family protein [Acidimicrobiales bacterium]
MGATTSGGRDTMILGTQYYRPPFPQRQLWHKDFADIVAAGLDTVQLWACWGWIEPEPGRYRFEDYDELMQEAADAGLRVVISTIAEIQPFWIDRELPDAHLVDHMGHVVRSSPRRECNVGLTPGACFDHPEVRDRMGAFLTALARRYASSKTLVAWDCWNETRWAVHGDGYVCHCRATVQSYREWLAARYGDLEGLGAAWHRRYASWDDVVPGKQPGRPYTDLVEFEAFLTARSAGHAAFRAECLRRSDTNHPVLAHCGKPAVYSSGMDYEQAVSRGNDFDLAEVLDGFGCSHFPAWEKISASELGTRIEATRSATGSKPAWVSELQGGRACAGFGVWPAVDPGTQQRWVWGAYGRGIKAVLFWCWRDEVFGREASGFGITGSDGQSAGRLERLAGTARVLRNHEALLDAYRPDVPEIAVLFSQGSYQLDWAENGSSAEQACGSTTGWLSVFERAQLPYVVVDAHRPGGLSGVKLLVMPWPLVVPPATGTAIVEWVRAGGVLVAESELDAFDERGFYRYPQDRPTASASALGISSLGRRGLDESASLIVGTDGDRDAIPQAVWLEALDTARAQVLGTSSSGDAVATRHRLGAGLVITLGTLAGLGYSRERHRGLEAFARRVAALAGVNPIFRVSPDDGEMLQWRSGLSGSSRLLFLTADTSVGHVTVSGGTELLIGGGIRPLLGGGASEPRYSPDAFEFDVTLSPDGIAVLAWGDGHA